MQPEATFTRRLHPSTWMPTRTGAKTAAV